MTTALPALDFKKIRAYADWRLLLFLVLILNVKLAIKIPAMVLIYLLQPNFKFGFSLKRSRLPLFYPVITALTLISLLANFKHLNGYMPVALTGLLFWLICLLCAHQVKRSVETQPTTLIHHTIFIFFVLNALVSFYNIALIIWEIKSFNPYVYQGQYQKYFISTGDFIRGISFDTSTTNAVVSAFGVIYFLDRKQMLMTGVCMFVLLLTGSNYINICLSAMLIALFIFKTDRVQKSLVVTCLALLILFMAKISPQNNNYALNLSAYLFLHKVEPPYVQPPKELPITQIPDEQLNPEQRRQKIAQLFIDSVSLARLQASQPKATAAPVTSAAPAAKPLDLPKPNIHTPPYQTRTFTDAEQNKLLTFIHKHKALLPIAGKDSFKFIKPGKLIAAMQTFSYLKQHPRIAIIGAGPGNFSSKLAYRAAGLGFAGSFPQKNVYINPDFLSNHLDVYLNFFSKRPGLHSLTNSPNSTYDQMLAEYGIFGLLAFLALYLGYFAKHYRRLTYGLPILALMAVAFLMDYWFEQLSVLIIFELMLFLNIKETQKQALTATPTNQAELEYAY